MTIVFGIDIMKMEISMPKGLLGFQKGNTLGRKFESGKRHWNWKGGYKYYHSGNGRTKYRRIKINNKYIAEHRYVMGQSIGRKLKRNEIVHHLNGNGLNNRIENLEIISQIKHNKIHRTGWKKEINVN